MTIPDSPALGGEQQIQIVQAIKHSDLARSSTTLLDDNHLFGFQFPGASGVAGSWWTLEYFFYITASSDTPDFKWQFVTDNTLIQSQMSFLNMNSASVLIADVVGPITNNPNTPITAANINHIWGKGFMEVGFFDNTIIDLQWARLGGGGTTTLKAGSWVRFTRIYQQT